jgi:FeS assembly SUF system protein
MMHHDGYGGMMGEEVPMPTGPILAGVRLEPGTPVAGDEDVVAALKTVHDPEIPVDIYELGLIYEKVIAEDGNCRVEMTLTAPACPVAGQLVMDVATAVSGVEGIGVCEVNLVWDPPWSPERMSEEARLLLDMW